MICFTLLNILVASALAAPLSTRSVASRVNGTAISSAQLDACERSSNCETYDGANGANIRFISGMEPGSSDYESRFGSKNRPRDLLRRQDSYSTSVTMSDKHFVWGDVRPYYYLQNLASICQSSGACVTTDSYSKAVQMTGGLDVEDGTLELTAIGTYPTWAQDLFVQSVATAAKAAAKCETVSWENGGGFDQTGESGKLHQCTMSNFIAITATDTTTDDLMGFVQATISWQTPNSGWCATVATIATDITGAVNAYAGTLLGLLSFVCDA